MKRGGVDAILNKITDAARQWSWVADEAAMPAGQTSSTGNAIRLHWSCQRDPGEHPPE
jgi:hypothetical protein